MMAIPRPPSVSASLSRPFSATSKPSPSSLTSITRRSPYSSYRISTVPSPVSAYACRTEFDAASVRASFRSATTSSDSERSREIPVSASRQSVMYSARAGMVRRTVRGSAVDAPRPVNSLFTRRPGVWGASTRFQEEKTPRTCASSHAQVVACLMPSQTVDLTRRGRLVAVAEDDGDRLALPVADDREGGDRAGGEGERYNPHNIVGTPDRLPVDRDDHVPAGSQIAVAQRVDRV